MKNYTKNGQVIPYHIIRKPIKNTYFRIKNGTLCVTTNHHTKEQAIEFFIDNKFDQLFSKLNLTKEVEPDYRIMLFGHAYELEVSHGRFHYERSGDKIYVKTLLTDRIKIKNRIYEEELKRKLIDIKPIIYPVITSMGLKELPIRIKYLKSKFGSYHKKHHEITLNSFLARLDTIYLIYVIYHEYAHVLEFNHSRAFYQLLDRMMPNHRVYQKDLKKIAIH
ncbi:MAG: YgjP-like metallopeptidase domain-containing protein [Acholeplasmataceae bacterium]|jgi:predicted metal-dependent hydrolase|nr:DUF45 domain-containing protein [Acholeplasmataceae bacterium]